MRLIVLDRSPYGDAPAAEGAEVLRDAAARAGAAAEVVAFGDERDPVLDGIAADDVVLVRADLRTDGDLETLVSAVWKLEGRGVRCLPGAEGLVAAEDKLRTYVRLRRDAVPTLPSVAVCVAAPRAADLASFHAYLRAFPVVIRRRVGWGGRGTVLCHDREALAAALGREAAERPEAAVLLQPHFPHRRAITVHVTDGRAVAARGVVAAAGEFRAHTDLGGVATDAPVSRAAASLAVRAAAACELRFAGVDLLEGEDGALVCSDVNSMPALRRGSASDAEFAGSIAAAALDLR